jgi:hypothetical protein
MLNAIVISSFIFPSLIAGVLLGLFWRGRIPSLVVVVTVAGVTAGVLVGDWQGFIASMFSSSGAVVHGFLILFAYFSLFLGPGMTGAVGVLLLRKSFSK